MQFSRSVRTDRAVDSLEFSKNPNARSRASGGNSNPVLGTGFPHD